MTATRRSICLALLLVLAQLSLCAADDLTAKVDEYLHAQLRLKNFSGSVLIAKEGKALVSKGYGMANYELDVPNTPRTKFRLGSITKQFTAMAVLQLQERGLLKVDDPITKHLPDYPKVGDKITIHHLLTHTSGIPNFTSFPDYVKTMMLPSPAEKTIERFKDKPLEFTPGEKMSYSNSGYVLLGYIVERVSGKPYEQYLQEKIFRPLGMRDSGYDHEKLLLENRASGYSPGPEGFSNAAYLDMTIPGGAGALYSTVEDLYLWDQALYTKKLVKQESLDRMFKPWTSTNPTTDYGYGWSISSVFGQKNIAHGGGINGFATFISRFPDQHAVIIVLSNLVSGRAGPIGKDLAAMLFGQPYEIPKERQAIQLDPKLFEPYVGRYEMRPGFVVTISQEGGRFFSEATGQPKVEIFPESEAKFFLKVVDAQITFVKSEAGGVDELILHQGGRDTRAKRIRYEGPSR